MAARRPRRRRAPRSTPPARSTRSASPTNARRRSSGTARPATRSGPASAGRTCARSATASRCAPRGCGSRRTSRRPSCSGCSTSFDPDRDRRPVLRHRRHVDHLDSHRRAGARHRRDQRRGHRLARARDHVGLGRRARSSVLSIPAAHAAGDRRLDRRSSAPRPRCPARRRSPASLGDQQAVAGRPGVRAPRRREDHVRHRRDARRHARHDGATARDTRPARHVPDRSRGARTVQDTYGIEAIMLAAGTNVQWLRDDLGLIESAARVARACAHDRRQRRCRVRPRAARARHTAVGLRRARRALRPHARHRRARTSCAPCSKASRTAAPISSRPPKPTPTSRSRRCASTAA